MVFVCFKGVLFWFNSTTKVAGGHALSSWGKSPALSDNPLRVLSLPLLYEKTLQFSRKKNQKRSEEIAKEISAAANYSMDQSCLRFLFFVPRQSNHPDCLYPKKVWLKGTQPKYLNKLTFALSALSIWVKTCVLF